VYDFTAGFLYPILHKKWFEYKNCHGTGLHTSGYLIFLEHGNYPSNYDRTELANNVWNVILKFCEGISFCKFQNEMLSWELTFSTIPLYTHGFIFFIT
jgi:hypothetical protein